MIETERLHLKPMEKGDAPFVLELLNTKEWIENIGQRNVYTIAEAEKYIQEKMINHYLKNGYGNYLMTRKEDHVNLGCVSLYNRADVDGVDIGFALLPQFFGKGYAYEGAKALVNCAQHEFGLCSICAFTANDNLPSQKLIMKLGLEFEKMIEFGDDKEELQYYKLEFDK